MLSSLICDGPVLPRLFFFFYLRLFPLGFATVNHQFHRTNDDTLNLACFMPFMIFRIMSNLESPINLSGMCLEARENPRRHRENTQTLHKKAPGWLGIEPRTFLLWGDSASIAQTVRGLTFLRVLNSYMRMCPDGQKMTHYLTGAHIDYWSLDWKLSIMSAGILI